MLVANGDAMAVVAYILLTVVVFALLGWAQRLVERL
ncbi:MAG: potassium ABC transporter ATPase [Mycobacterium sp.]|nr:potassium ABC transporter ATPase [Mycobacterium sp.]MDI3314981.1 potassium ABC transporter ATPase [Mycobacterium sp.]